MALQTKTVSTGDYHPYSWANGYMITLSLTEQEVDHKTNTSSVSYKFTISSGDAKRFRDAGYSWSIFIAGQNIPIVDFDFDLYTFNTTQTIASGRLTVKHNPDGTLNMPYSVSIPNVKSYNSNGPAAMELTGTWELTHIPRIPEVYCPDGFIGETVAIKVDALDTDLTYNLTYSFWDLQGTIDEYVPAGEILWTIPQSFYSQIPCEREGVCVISCEAYSEDVKIGGGDYEITVKVDPEANAPTVSAEITDVNPETLALTGDASRLVRYCSNARVVASCQGKNGATVESYRLLHNGGVYTQSDTVIPGVESGEFRLEVTDSRGFITTVNVTKAMIPYIKLSCDLSDNKPDTDGNMTVKVSGNYFNSTFGLEENSLNVAYRCKIAGGEYGEWIPLTGELAIRSFKAEGQLAGLDYKAAYVFQARAADKLCTIESAEYTVRATPVFDWDENDFNVNGDFKINNETVADFVVARGKNDIWVWEKWNSGIVKCWGQTGGKIFTFTGDGPVYHSETVHSYNYPVDLTEVISVNAHIVSESYVVPVVLSISDELQVACVRLYGGSASAMGHYLFQVLGRWK